MNREILFRGKRIDNGEWVEGSLLQGKKADYDDNDKYIGMKDCAIIVLSSGLSSMNLGYCGECSIPYDPDNSFEVIPETVGQYTGLTDKNGKKIFEGDIVRVFEGERFEFHAAEVIYCEDIGQFRYVEKLLFNTTKNPLHIREA